MGFERFTPRSSAWLLLVLFACSSEEAPGGGDGDPDSAAGASGSTNAGAAAPSTTRPPAGAAGSAAAPTGVAGADSGANADEPMANGGTGGATAGPSGAGVDGAAGSQGGAGMPSAAEPRPPASSFMLETTMEPAGVEPWFNVYRPADLDATGQPLPVIAWANGGCLRVDFAWATLFERWAMAGFVVLALTESPADGLFGQTTSADQGEMIDWALAQAELPGGAYQGKLDTTKIVAAGNSCGGVTALGLAAVDERVAAVFVLSGSSAIGTADAEVMGAIRVPVGFVVGNPEEDIAAGPAGMDYELLPDGVPGMIVRRATGDHFLVSSDAEVLKDDAEIGLSWIDLALYGTPEAADELTSPNVCSICEPGVWTLESKHLDALRR